MRLGSVNQSFLLAAFTLAIPACGQESSPPAVTQDASVTSDTSSSETSSDETSGHETSSHSDGSVSSLPSTETSTESLSSPDAAVSQQPAASTSDDSYTSPTTAADSGVGISSASTTTSAESTQTEENAASCDADLPIDRVGDKVVRARLSVGWVFQVENDSRDASLGSCLSPCNECVTLVNGHDNYCSHACDNDNECDAGETCFGCGEFKACLLRCDNDDDCLANSGTCQEGICLWST